MSYEYVPREVATKISDRGTTELAISEKDIPTSPFTVLTGKMKLFLSKNTATEKILTTRVKTAGILQVNTYAFPGWKVLVDGKNYSYLVNNPLHLMQLPLVAGSHSVSVLFVDTPIRTISNCISLITLVVLCGIIVWSLL